MNSVKGSSVHATRLIRESIMDSSISLRKKHPILECQNAIGASILILCVLGFFLSSYLFIVAHLPWWGCILLNAFLISIVHEIEHDLIHNLYFKNNKFIHNTMMLLAWIVRPSTSNPWVRRRLHLRHHQTSGTEDDWEERAITNGVRWGLLRLYMTADVMLASLMLIVDTKDRGKRREMAIMGWKSFFPLTIVFWGTWYFFIAFYSLDLFMKGIGSEIIWSIGILEVIHYLDILMVVLIAPNILWSFCLHFISSNMHYYGDIRNGDVVQQTQVLNSKWLLPFQIFCFNFGSTHGIHHFVVNDPFYIRQMTAKVAHKAMKEAGVRFNDLGTFTRANRWDSR